MNDSPDALPPPLAARLAVAADADGKIARALEALGPLAGREVALIGDAEGPHAGRLAATGARLRPLPASDPFRTDLADRAVDAVVSLWSGFRGVEAASVAEADRILNRGGRLLVVHDYGRDDVSGLRDPASPEYTSWSRRTGPFLRGGFRIRVVHGFWTFGDLDEARSFLAEAYGERGVQVGGALRRPRLTWNVAIYHRSQGGLPSDPGRHGIAGEAAG